MYVFIKIPKPVVDIQLFTHNETSATSLTFPAEKSHGMSHNKPWILSRCFPTDVQLMIS